MEIKQQLIKMMSIFRQRANEKSLFLDIKNSFTSDGKLIFAGELLKTAYLRYPNKTALIGRDKTITYKEFYFRATQLTKKLKDYGVEPHDRVILLSENSIDFYISYFGIWQAGAVVVPINIFLHEKELTYIINDCAPKVIIVSESLKEIVYKVVQQKLVENYPLILTQNEIDWQTQVPSKKAELEFEIEKLEENDLCLLLYTSGTTGSPKGVMLSSKNVLTNAMQCYARLSLTGKKEAERFFSVLPLFHVFAQNTCLWLPIMTGSSIIIVQKIDRKLILEGLEKEPTLFFGFPALYGLLCLLRNAPLDSVRMFVSGADMLPDKIRSAFATIYGRRICSGYGLTEAAPVIAVNIQNDGKATQFVGHTLVGIDFDIRDENENSLTIGQIGNLWVKGDNIMLGYYNAPEATANVLKDGWLNTGDLGMLDEDLNLAIMGRNKDLIIHKGFNIYPQEIENILMTHPAVFKAAVIGKPESMVGEIPIAFVAVKSMAINLEDSLRDLCTKNLAQYKIPRKFVCLDDLPMNTTGKVDKKQLQF